MEHKDLESRRKTRESKKGDAEECSVCSVSVKCGGKNKMKHEVAFTQCILPGVKELKKGSDTGT
jgi:hypothetical protein